MRIALERPDCLFHRRELEKVVIVERQDVRGDVMLEDVVDGDVARIGHAVAVLLAKEDDTLIVRGELLEGSQALFLIRVIVCDDPAPGL